MNVSHANESRESCCAAAYTPEWYPPKGERIDSGGKPKTEPGRRRAEMCPTRNTRAKPMTHLFVSKNWLLGFFLSFRRKKKTKHNQNRNIFGDFPMEIFREKKTYPCRWNHRLRSLGNRYRWSCPRYWYTERTRHKVDTCTHFHLVGGGGGERKTKSVRQFDFSEKKTDTQ